MASANRSRPDFSPHPPAVAAGIPSNAVDMLGDQRPLPVDREIMSPIAGWHHDREPWVAKSGNGQDMVGVRFKVSDWANKPILRSCEPLFDRFDNGQAEVVVAKPGYVVGGILVDSDEQEHGIRLVFMKVLDGRLDTSDSYLSDWIGSPVSGTPPKLIGGHGEHVTGLCGYRGMNLDGVGLILNVH